MFQTTYKQIYKPSFTDIKVEQQKGDWNIWKIVTFISK